jgi:SanA protein
MALNVHIALFCRSAFYMNIRKILKYFFLFVFLTPLVLAALVWLNSAIISLTTSKLISNKTDQLEKPMHTMILGAGQYKPEQWVNHSFNHRVEAAVELYRNGKTEKIIVSGTAKEGLFNEPEEMRKVLITFGVPDSVIIKDSLGSRTWESVSNLNRRYTIKEALIVTQRPHLERSLFISWCNGIEAQGFEAKPVPHHHRYWNLREYLARAKATCDCIKHHLG